MTGQRGVAVRGDHRLAAAVRDPVAGQARRVPEGLPGPSRGEQRVPGEPEPAAGLVDTEHPGPRVRQARGDGEQERAGTGDHDPASREDQVALEQRLRAARGEHPRQVPAGERQRPVVRAGGDQQPARGHRPGPLLAISLQAPYGDRLVRAFDRPDPMAQQHLGALAERLPLAGEPAEAVVERAGPRGVKPLCGVPEVLAARPGGPVDQYDVQPGQGRGERARDPRRARADHGEVMDPRHRPLTPPPRRRWSPGLPGGPRSGRRAGTGSRSP